MRDARATSGRDEEREREEGDGVGGRCETEGVGGWIGRERDETRRTDAARKREREGRGTATNYKF